MVTRGEYTYRKMKELNLCEILKGYEGETFYCPIYGDVYLTENHGNFLTISKDKNASRDDMTEILDCKGRIDSNGECMLFPSKDQRDWNKWLEKQNPKVPKTWSELSNEDKSRVNAIIGVIEYGVDSILTPIEKSALALLKIHQLIEVGYGGNITDEEWFDYDSCIYVIEYNGEDEMYKIITAVCYKSHIAFHTKEQAEEFLKYFENVQLLKDYFMIIS